MKTFEIEHELPPLRAIYASEVDCETEEEARAVFAKEKPSHRIRKITSREFKEPDHAE